MLAGLLCCASAVAFCPVLAEAPTCAQRFKSATGLRMIARHIMVFGHRMECGYSTPARFAVIAMEDRTCAVASMFRQNIEPPMIFCGTTTMSPGSIFVSSTPSLYHSPERRPTTEPLARITKISFVFAMFVDPPACRRYQLAFLPGTNVIAAAL